MGLHGQLQGGFAFCQLGRLQKSASKSLTTVRIVSVPGEIRRGTPQMQVRKLSLDPAWGQEVWYIGLKEHDAFIFWVKMCEYGGSWFFENGWRLSTRRHIPEDFNFRLTTVRTSGTTMLSLCSHPDALRGAIQLHVILRTQYLRRNRWRVVPLLKVIKHRATKTCGEWRYNSTILDVGSRWGVWLALLPSHFTLWKSPRYSLNRRLGGPTAGLGAVE
jgi:nitrogen fixation protein